MLKCLLSSKNGPEGCESQDLAGMKGQGGPCPRRGPGCKVCREGLPRTSTTGSGPGSCVWTLAFSVHGVHWIYDGNHHPLSLIQIMFTKALLCASVVLVQTILLLLLLTVLLSYNSCDTQSLHLKCMILYPLVYLQL